MVSGRSLRRMGRTAFGSTHAGTMISKRRFPPIVEALAALKTEAVFDGEIVALDDTGHPRFEWLVNRGPQKGTLVYYVFDLLRLGDVNLRTEPL